MAGPVNAQNADGRSIDTIYTPAGDKAVKVGIGNYPATGDMGDTDGAGQVVGTHEASGATLGAADAVVTMAGVDGSVNDPIVPVLVDSLGRLQVVFSGASADDAPPDPTPGHLTFPTSMLADDAGTDSVDDGELGTPRMLSDRRQVVVANLQPVADEGGLTPFKRVSTASTNAAVIKASAGKLFNVFCNNVNAAVRYLKLYDKITAPTIGTDVPVFTFAIPAGSNININFGPHGVPFALGIGMGMTTEATDAGTTGVSASEHVVNIAYA